NESAKTSNSVLLGLDSTAKAQMIMLMQARLPTRKRSRNREPSRCWRSDGTVVMVSRGDAVSEPASRPMDEKMKSMESTYWNTPKSAAPSARAMRPTEKAEK